MRAEPGPPNSHRCRPSHAPSGCPGQTRLPTETSSCPDLSRSLRPSRYRPAAVQRRRRMTPGAWAGGEDRGAMGEDKGAHGRVSEQHGFAMRLWRDRYGESHGEGRYPRIAERFTSRRVSLDRSRTRKGGSRRRMSASLSDASCSAEATPDGAVKRLSRAFWLRATGHVRLSSGR